MITVIKSAISLDRLPAWTRGRGCVNNVLTTRWGGKTVEFGYKTRDTLGCKSLPIENRTVQVELVFDYNGSSYLHGYCYHNKEVRSYALRADRMYLGHGEVCAVREVENYQPALF